MPPPKHNTPGVVLANGPIDLMICHYKLSLTFMVHPHGYFIVAMDKTRCKVHGNSR